MRRKPLVSVITIFLNEERFLSEAVESVIAQTYDNWELLLADDGSTDGSTEIARRFVERFPDRIRYLEHEGHENRGMSASRNLAFRHARGDYITIIDGDDSWLPHKLERQLEIMESHPDVGLLFGASEYWAGWTGRPEDQQRDRVQQIGVPPNQVFEPPSLVTACYPLGPASAPCPSDLMLRRNVVEHVGGFEDSFRGFYEDQAFLVKVYLEARVFVSNECLDRYRLHEDSCCAVVERAGEYDVWRHRFLRWFQGYLDRRGVTSSEVRGALREALRQYEHPVLFRWGQRARSFAAQIRAPLDRLRGAAPGQSSIEGGPAHGEVKRSAGRRII